MRTIDWPLDLTQTYVNVDMAARTIALDDDHQAVGKHSLVLDAAQARELAAVHRAVAQALDDAAETLSSPPVTGIAPPPAPPVERNVA